MNEQTDEEIHDEIKRTLLLKARQSIYNWAVAIIEKKEELLFVYGLPKNLGVVTCPKCNEKAGHYHFEECLTNPEKWEGKLRVGTLDVFTHHFGKDHHYVIKFG